MYLFYLINLQQVAAHDADTGTAGQVMFALDNTPGISDLFNIDRNSGILSLRGVSLDREVRPQYMFHVLAHDLGEPRLTSSTAVVITVLDENDNRPKFVP
jgi:protocadherin delta 1